MKGSLVVSTLPVVFKRTRTVSGNEQVTQGASITLAKWALSPTPNRFICMNLSELMLAKLAKVVAQQWHSGLCTVACLLLYTPPRQSPFFCVKKTNIFRLCSSGLTLCRAATRRLASQATNSGEEKNRRHTPSKEHVSVANVTAGDLNRRHICQQ